MADNYNNSKAGPSKSIQHAQLEDKALGQGDPTSADKSVGKQNARWASVDLTGGGNVANTIKEYDVLHDLKETATTCTLESFENAVVAGTFIVANAVRRENWSHGHCHVSIRLISGSFDGCVARFRVGGK